MVDTSSEQNVHWTVKEVESVEGIKDLRLTWVRLLQQGNCPKIDSDINRYLSVLTALECSRPVIFVLYRNLQPVALLIGRIHNIELKHKVGYKVLMHSKLKCLTIVYSGFLGLQTVDTCDCLISAVKLLLSSGKADVAEFEELDTSSLLNQQIRLSSNFFCRSHFNKTNIHWIMRVPDDIDNFYNDLSKKHRSNVKRMIRKLDTDHEVEIVTTRKTDKLEKAIEAASEISSKTYQSGLGSGFVNDEFTRSLLNAAGENDWLRLHILYVNGDPCAFQLGLQYGSTYYLQQLGYDPKWKKLSIGTTLFLIVLEKMCADSTVHKIDFGFGDAAYKKSYGNQSWSEETVFVFAPRMYPLWVNTLKSLTTGLSIALTSIVNKLGIEKKIKRYWRNQLQKDNHQ